MSTVSDICLVVSNMSNDLPLQGSDPTHDYVSKMISQIHEENSHLLDEFVAGDEFVTDDEVAANWSRKEKKDNESDSLDGSWISGDDGTLSGISTCSALNSLSALKTRKNQLINSIRNELNSSTVSENILATPNTSVIGENVCTSTPFREDSVPLAAKFLKEWKSSYLNFDDIQSANESDDDDDDLLEKTVINMKFEEAVTSLSEVLSKSHHHDDILDAYENTLDAYKTENDKKFDEMLNFFSDLKEPYKEDLTIVDADRTLNDDTLIEADSNDNTVIAKPTDLNEKTELSEELKTVDVDQSREVSKKPCEDDKESDAKDPENLIIGGEEIAAEITPVDEERLLASDDEAVDNAVKPIAAPCVVKELEVFISQDEDENRDNNDPQWDFVRHLGSDFERFKFVHQHWGSCVIPNPKKDLTCRCRKSTKVNGFVAANSASSISENQPRKRPHSPTPNGLKSKKPRWESCTMLFDRHIQNLFRTIEVEKRKLEYEQELALNRLAQCQQLDQIAAYQQRANEGQVRAMQAKHFRETENLIRDFRHRYDIMMESSKQKIEDFRQAACEVRELHEFYPDPNLDRNNQGDNNSLVYLTDVEVREIIEIDEMLDRFEHFYDRPST